MLCKNCSIKEIFCKDLCRKCYYRTWRANNLKYYKEYYQKIKDNPEYKIKRIKYYNLWEKNNKEKFLAINSRWRKNRYHNDLNFRLREVISNRIRDVIKNQNSIKTDNTIELLGCSIRNFRIHIEKQFKIGMIWNNYGEWELDHIIPCASFDLTKEEEQRKCFHYTNYQPLWWQDNLKKGCKV